MWVYAAQAQDPGADRPGGRRAVADQAAEEGVGRRPEGPRGLGACPASSFLLTRLALDDAPASHTKIAIHVLAQAKRKQLATELEAAERENKTQEQELLQFKENDPEVLNARSTSRWHKPSPILAALTDAVPPVLQRRLP